MSSVQQRWKLIVDFVRKQEVSDISLYGGNIAARLDGRIVRLSEEGALGKGDIQELISDLLSLGGRMIDPGRPTGFVDFTVTLFAKRFRVNVARARGELFASLRPLPDGPFPAPAIGLTPQLLQRIAGLPHGLVLVTGPTGSGKTTTIATLIEMINQSRQVKVITIEDPIEFEFQAKQAEIIQREIGLDSPSYDACLRESLRQNPDVIVVGEIRDAETAIVALQAAETGHLVIGSLHADSVVESISRYLLLGPPERSAEMRYVLARTMRVIMNQRLLRRRSGGRVAIREICLHAPKVEAVILKGNEQELVSYMLSGRETGMIDFQSALKAMQSVIDPQEFLLHLRGESGG